MSFINRLAPLLLAMLLWGIMTAVWIDTQVEETALLAWVNIIIMGVISMVLLGYGIRLQQAVSSRAGSLLRSKLVIAFVGMLFVSSTIIQSISHQLVEKGLNTWFDVRVDKVLDQALHLAQGFYTRVDTNLKQNMFYVANDQTLLTQLGMLPDQLPSLHLYLADILQRHNWQGLRIYDFNEHLIANIRQTGLADLKPEPLNAQAKLALKIGHISTELTIADGSEIAVGYAPLRFNQKIIGLLQAEITMPEGIVNDAQDIEKNYRSYRELERNRQSIGSVFTHIMLLTTLCITVIAGLIAVVFSRRMTTPIDELAKALHQIRDGNLDVIIPRYSDDELGSLVNSFNQMAQRLKHNMQALEIAQRELEQSLDDSQQRQYILETLLSNLQSGALIVSREGNIRLINKALQQRASEPEAWVVQHNIHTLRDDKTLGMIAHFFEAMQDEHARHWQQEFEMVTAKKTKHYLLRGTCLHRHTQHDGNEDSSGYLILMDDITDLAEAQRHRAWSEVAQRLAHEIKNPLTPIKLAAERLQRRFRTQVDDENVFNQCTHAIINQTDRLQRLVADFSTLARMPEPKMLDTSVQDIFADLQELYDTYPRMRIQMPDNDMPLFCDSDQIRQVMINLINNALAATQEQQQAVNVYASNEAGVIHLHVWDEGSGIPEHEAAHIFEPYFSTKSDGSGLGLAIAERIAEDHHGHLMLVSRAKPTHFCLSLPMQTA